MLGAHLMTHARDIIIADADIASRRPLVAALVMRGYRVHEAGTAAEVIDRLAEALTDSAHPQIVVFGAVVPGAELIDSYDIWQGVYRVLGVICICDAADRVSLERAGRMHALATFVRPVDADVIADACDRAVHPS
jgi:DNA-binding NtrC family response regulator